jgi:hypothetical protein
MAHPVRHRERVRKIYLAVIQKRGAPHPKELLEPLPMVRRGLGLTESGKKPVPSLDVETWKSEHVRRLKILATHYAITLRDDFFEALLFQVLSDWIPGFREPRAGRRGRPSDDRRKKHPWEQRLLLEVDKMREDNKSLSNLDACKIISRRRGENEFRKPPETLRKALRAARKAHQHRQKLVEKWGLAFVTDYLGIQGD